MSWINLVASIVAAVGALWLVWGERKETRRSKAIAALVALASITAVIDGFRNTKAQERFEKDMRLRTEETLRHVTGGDATPQVALSSLSTSATEAWLIVRNLSSYPVYDLALSVVDLEEQKRLEAKGVPKDDAFLRSIRHVPQFNLGPGQVRLDRHWKIAPSDRVRYGINGTARNGAWFQALRYLHIDGEWIEASRVTRNDKVVYEKIDRGFPRDANGEPEW